MNDRIVGQQQRRSYARRAARFVVPLAVALGLSVLMTWPLAAGLDRLGRDNGDGLFSVWNVAWVARALTTDPTRLFNANIFYPERQTLAFSEANIGAGVLGAPAWLLSGNPYVAHNSVVLLAFATGALGAWLLLRRLTGDPYASAPAALLFAFCPYLFAHTSHIQLLLVGGIPLSLLALHRLVDAPTVRRGVVLGLVLAAQALSCAYYGVLAGLLVGFGVLFFAVSRRLWASVSYWRAVAAGAGTAIAGVAPFFLPYLQLQSRWGFHRSLDEAAQYSANWWSYLASPARAHGWLLALISDGPGWTEVLFPGVLALLLGGAGFVLLLRRSSPFGWRGRETAIFYASIGALAMWASFGPEAGLYRVLAHIPVFSFLRAPSRFGIVVPLVLAVLAAFACLALTASARPRRAFALASVAVLAVLLELRVAPFAWEPAVPRSSAYLLLAELPNGPIAKFPFYGERVAFPLHARYMVHSTLHWKPMINGYSDLFPARFRDESRVLDSFPSFDSFEVLRRQRTRYIGIHWPKFGSRQAEVRARLQPFMPHLRLLASDERVALYEIVSFP